MPAPYRVYTCEGGGQIERHVPTHPLGRDLERFTALRRCLAVYWTVFGQPQQEGLTTYLLTRIAGHEIERLAEDLRSYLEHPQTR